ncbi:MarR family winged helix-turn-helix transcriptional regulator [Actinomadura verrucosospora]|uniref:MarR family transcriptional regulator n=1 Tax=Actinomadura verrucosospora TaxID=46165 RepID=A0A7D3ZR76_ACTVE|nr:MarR family transcriptional regulator [Actinomadura verrucosospora]QKG24562.1 MarR family transcriptional regulator [Actinomadura verrucosospora]
MTEHRWLDDREQRAWRGYLAMSARLSARMNRDLQNESGLSLTDYDVLVQLTDRPSGCARVLELAESLQWEKSRLSHHIARMTKRGLVDRREVEGDARGTLIALTGKGRRAIEEAAPAHVAAIRDLIFDHLTEDQVKTLHAITDTVLARLD